MATCTVAQVVTAVRSRITAEVAGIRILDRVLPNEQPDHMLHKGITVWSPSTELVERYANADEVWVRDTVEVRVDYKLPPKNQNAGLTTLLGLEESVRIALTDTSWASTAANSTTILVNYEGASREPVGTEWIQSTSVFTIGRQAELGGA